MVCIALFRRTDCVHPRVHITDSVCMRPGTTSTAHRDQQSQLKVLATAVIAHDNGKAHICSCQMEARDIPSAQRLFLSARGTSSALARYARYQLSSASRVTCASLALLAAARAQPADASCVSSASTDVDSPTLSCDGTPGSRWRTTQ